MKPFDSISQSHDSLSLLMPSKHDYGAVELKETTENGDLQEENVEEKISVNAFSIIIIYLVVVTTDMCRGVLFPTLWLIISSLGGTRYDQGLAIASFSIGRLISSTIFGFVAERYGYQVTFTISNVMILVGCFVYTNSTAIILVLLAQFTFGFGAGSLGASRSYIAETTPLELRTTKLAHLTALQYGGFTITPVFGAGLAAFSRYYLSMDSEHPRWGMTDYTFPCLLLLLVASCSIIGVHCKAFYDPYKEGLKEQKQRKESQRVNDSSNKGEEDRSSLLAIDKQKHSQLTSCKDSHNHHNNNHNNIDRSVESIEQVTHPTSYHIQQQTKQTRLLVVGCLLNFFYKGAMGIYETLVIVIVTKEFAWTPWQSGLSISLCGLFACLCLLSFHSLQVYIMKDIDMVWIGFVLMIVSNILFCLWPMTIARLSIALFLLFSVGYPIGHTALLGVYAKVCKKGEKQAKIMGIFGSAGSIARIVMPMMAGYLAQEYELVVVFVSSAIMLTLCGICTLYGRIVYASMLE